MATFVNSNTMAAVGNAAAQQHNWKYIQLANMEQAKQLKACTPFLKDAWWTDGDDVAVPYADAAAWAFQVATLAEGTRAQAWIEYYLRPAAVDRVLMAAFGLIDKRPYKTEGEFLNALDNAVTKADGTAITAMDIGAADWAACLAHTDDAMRLTPAAGGGPTGYEWMTHVTLGHLMDSSQGARNVAWLERATTERRGRKEWNKGLDALLSATKDEGRSADDTADDDCAHIAVHWLDTFVCLGPEHRTYANPWAGRSVQMLEEAKFAHTAQNGESAFAQSRTVPLVAVKTTVIRHITEGANGPRELNGYLLDIAAALLTPELATPGRVFTSSGVQLMERHARCYAAWAAELTTKAMPTAARITAFCTRVRENARGAPGLGDVSRDVSGNDKGLTTVSVGAGFNRQLTTAREKGDNPSLLESLTRFTTTPGADPLDALGTAFTGQDDKNPNRKPTGLSQCAAAHAPPSWRPRGTRTHAHGTGPASRGPPRGHTPCAAPRTSPPSPPPRHLAGCWAGAGSTPPWSTRRSRRSTSGRRRWAAATSAARSRGSS